VHTAIAAICKPRASIALTVCGAAALPVAVSLDCPVNQAVKNGSTSRVFTSLTRTR
jgi:hypothetical protein